MMLQSQKLIHKRRGRRIDQEGTAPLIFLNSGDIAVDTDAGGNIIDFEAEAKTIKYFPFDFLSINNTSSSDLNVYINQNIAWKKIIRANTVVNISDFSGIRSVRISKRDATVTITAGEVETTVMRQALSSDEQVRREATTSPLKSIVKRILGV